LNLSILVPANALFDTWISDLHSCLKLLLTVLFRELPVA
jgi:hypothetical protein